ncbi:MAG: FAD-binding oxidoreductase [Gordonia sp.]|nr:FAD-binding oxidoreductase [Gordonia sp. (in: high G+C Gram-positive bacteria)]
MRSPLQECVGVSDARCAELFRELKNPYFIGDDPGLTQTTGWFEAWDSKPSVYAIAATSAADIKAGVDFARERNLRLVVRGGGDSYQGTSNAADSLLIWTRRMRELTMHDGFVGRGCERTAEPVPAVTLGAGRLWGHTYNEVGTGHGRYVQGGGCATVGVAGLVQSGGFGSFSKRYGTAASNLLEAEIVTADGQVRVVNECQDPDLLWALKGGGGGTFGAVSRITLATHDLPQYFGYVGARVAAESDEGFRGLIARTVDFYADELFNVHWGESFDVNHDRSIDFSMTFQGLDDAQARRLWDRFLGSVRSTPGLKVEGELTLLTIPANRFWDPSQPQRAPTVLHDDRPGAPAGNFFEQGNLGEAGWYLHGYQSAWLPADLLAPARRASLVDMLHAAAHHFSVSIHCNKGLAGGDAAAIARSRDTAMNPAAFDAFALAIVAGGGDPAYPGVPGHEPNTGGAASRDAAAITAAMGSCTAWCRSPRPGPTCRRPTTSTRTGRTRTSDPTTRGWRRSRRRTTRRACSTCTTVSAARDGRTTVSPGARVRSTGTTSPETAQSGWASPQDWEGSPHGVDNSSATRESSPVPSPVSGVPEVTVSP